MSPKYKLYYFDLIGIAEFIRWIFVVADEEFDDVRIEYNKTGENWQRLKLKFPNEQVPVLEFQDGRTLYQSVAIARYLARQYGLVGDNPFDEAKADAIVDTVQELMNPLHQVVYAKGNQEKMAELKKQYAEKYNKVMKNFEKLCPDDGYFINGKLTWADICFSEFFDYYELVTGDKEDFEPFPKLKKVYDNVRNIPRIAEWVKGRKVTDC